MADTLLVGMRLDADCHESLRVYAEAHHWKVATAARIIICDYLEGLKAQEEEKVT